MAKRPRTTNVTLRTDALELPLQEGLEAVISELSADFLALPTRSIDGRIEFWLERIATALDVERSTLAQITDEEDDFQITHCYAAPGYPRLSGQLCGRELPWLVAQMRRGCAVSFTRVADLPSEAVLEREFITLYGPKSHVSLPLEVSGQLIGIIAFAAMRQEREWPTELVRRLRLVADIFAGALMRKREQRLIEEMLIFEQLVSGISRTFIGVAAEDIDAELNRALQCVGEFLGVDRCAIYAFSPDVARLARTHCHVVEGVEPDPEVISPDFPWMLRMFASGEPLVVTRVRDLPGGAAQERDYLERQGIRSVLAFPLCQGQHLMACAMFSAVRTEKRWPAPLVERLRLVGEVFANALTRRMMENAQQGLQRFERFMSALSGRLAGLSGEHVHAEMTHILHAARAQFDVEVCLLAESADATDEVRVAYLACDDDVGPLLRDADYARACPWECAQLFSHGAVVAIERPGDLPAGAAQDRCTRQGLGVRSSLGVPIALGGGARHAIWVGTSREPCAWPDERVARLRLLGETLVSALNRARGESALQVSEERFRRVVEAVPNGVIMIDAQGRILLANPGAESIFGYRRNGLQGLPVEAVLPYRFRGHRNGRLDDSTILPAGRGRELQGRRRDGTTVPIELGLSPVRTLEGFCVLATVVDISQRKSAEVALQAAIQRLSEARRIANLGSWEWDAVNDSFLGSDEVPSILGAIPADFDSWIDLIHPADRTVTALSMERVFRAREPRYDLEYRVQPPDGTERIVHDQGEVHYAPDGAVLRVLGTMQDVTATRQVEHEMRRLRVRMWHADRVMRVGALTASLAHELKQPLTAILSNAQAGLRFCAQAQPDLDEIRDILGDIVCDDKRAAAVINGLRAMMRREEVEREHVDLAAVVGDTLELLHSELVSANVEVTRDLQAVRTVLGSATQLQQVVLNLVMNAVEAMRDAGMPLGRLHLSVRDEPDGGVRVAAIDSGPGMSDDQLAKVFEPFWSTKTQGMGLGLSLCRSIVEAHGGRIRASRNAGTPGLCVEFELPTAPSRAATERHPKS